jgi:hypothetical protein
MAAFAMVINNLGAFVSSRQMANTVRYYLFKIKWYGQSEDVRGRKTAGQLPGEDADAKVFEPCAGGG